MAPRKKTAKVKPPAKRNIPNASSEETGRAEGKKDYRALRTAEELRDVMGAESDDSLSNSENESFRNNTNQSRPNFSFLPSHKHSSPNKNYSPKRTNVGSAHRLASMPTVPNTDHEETSSTASTSATRKTPRKSSAARETVQPSTSRQPHIRKQKIPGQLKVLKDIINLQSTVHNLIPRLCFGRVIREILSEYSNRSLKVTPDMLLCLQEASEIYLVQLFEDAYRCTLHRDRVTLIPKDMQLAFMLRRN
ncbi:uncharacterized protein LOC125765711 [Anopheles funestus]|uniref:uncharacterized protein LOC125765711 n=1 Tax=Anopheles funestus TaxID=62324 RepID=UPI0020C6E91C|nr:uncharacterized protein LOC125765711 [Anopheles funestus]